MASSILKTIYIARTSEIHIPYLLGCKVIGPKGGEYMLDRFNYEQLLKHYNNEEYKYRGFLELEEAVRKGTEQVVITGYTGEGDGSFAKLANKLGLIPLIRLSGFDKTKKLAQTLELSTEILDDCNYILAWR